MPTDFSILIWFLLVLNVLALTFWLIIAYRVLRIVLRRPTIRDGLQLPTPERGWPRASVIVPAHNEERSIDACARSLRAQAYEDLEIIFVLDRCSDRTREILTVHEKDDSRVRVIENDSCPDDWAGKCNAARLGAEQATGDCLLFTDADTQFDPELVRASVALLLKNDLSLLSLLSTLTFHHRFERIVQPVASMNLVRMYPIERVNRAENSRPFANGQFMLFSRAMYEAIGGHTSVKDDLLEDIAFARRVHGQGGRCGVYLADGMLTCSMYESFSDFKQGWQRIFLEACKRKPKRLRQNALRVLAAGAIIPGIQIVGLAIGVTAIAHDMPVVGAALGSCVSASWLVQWITVSLAYQLGGTPSSWKWSLTYPIGCWHVMKIMREAVRDLEEGRPVRWGGREYVLEPRY